jgi:hypothetical protein
MIQNVLQNIGGVGLYGVTSILLFFGLFLVILIWVARLKKPYLNSMRDLPLLDDETAPSGRPQPSANLESRHE